MNYFIAYSAGIGVAGVHLMTVVWPRAYNRHYGVDGWKHLLAAEYIRQHKRLPGRLPGKYIIDEPYNYPPLLPILLALLPRPWRERYEWAVASCIDALHSLLLFGIVFALTSDLALGLLAQGFYMLTPAVVRESSALNTRTAGSLLFSGTFLCELAFAHSREPGLLLGAVLLGFLLVHTHKMSVQALVFASVGFAIWERNPAYLVTVALIAAAAVVLSGGYYLRFILPGHLAILTYWRERIREGNQIGTHQVRGGRPRWSHTLVNQNPFILLVIVAAIVLRTPTVGNAALAEQYPLFLAWALGMYGIALVITWYRPLRFLGEGERYMEYGAFPTAIVSAVVIGEFLLSGFNPFLLLLVVVTGALSLRSVLRWQRLAATSQQLALTPALREVIQLLDQRPEEVRFACIPTWPSEPVAYFTSSKVLWHDNGLALHRLVDYFPVLRRPLPEILSEYDINYFLVHEDYVTVSELGLTGWQTALRKDGLHLLRAPAGPSGHEERLQRRCIEEAKTASSVLAERASALHGRAPKQQLGASLREA